jgi:putative chitinase
MSFKFDFTFQKLQIVLAGAPHLDSWYAALNEILPDYEIDTVQRVGCFLGQTAHESGNYRAIRENLNYKAEGLIHIFGSHFPGGLAEAKQYEHNQERIANRIYENRMGNGPESSGDGFKFRGRGLIQLTGRENYQFFADSIGEDIESIPAFLETFEGAVQSACYFWESAKLNALADKGDIKRMTKVINGGYLGLAERTAHIQHAIEVLSS